MIETTKPDRSSQSNLCEGLEVWRMIWIIYLKVTHSSLTMEDCKALSKKTTWPAFLDKQK